MSFIIKLKSVHKRFRIREDSDNMLFGLFTSLFRGRKTYHINSLKNINFELKQGDVLGIIGANGAGKTTLLQIIAHILKPTKGSVKTKGTILPIIELGSDINPELSGKDNIFLSGSILGLKKSEIRKRYKEIVKFSGLNKFIEVQTKFYSAGMRLRLAFSILILANPDIILIDEVFGVGDLSFRVSCLNKLEEYRKQKKTIVFVSQDLEFIKSFCNKCVYLDKGSIRYFGSPINASMKYLEHAKEHNTQTPERFGLGTIELTDCVLKKSNLRNSTQFKQGERIIFDIHYKVNKKVKDPMFGVGIFSQDGSWITGPNTTYSKATPSNLKDKGIVRFEIPSNPFTPGKYYVSVAVLDHFGKIVYDKHDKMYSFSILPDGSLERHGMIRIPHKWTYL